MRSMHGSDTRRDASRASGTYRCFAGTSDLFPRPHSRPRYLRTLASVSSACSKAWTGSPRPSSATASWSNWRGSRKGCSGEARARVECAAYGRGGSSEPEPDYYRLLGLDPDCDEEDIRAAFRRRAKELHPDVNKEDGATEAFVQLSRAYEVLSDPESRRSYDITYGTRRLNFFRDIVEEDERPSPFGWSRVGSRRPGGGGGGGGGWPQPFSDEDEDDEDEEDDGRRRAGGRGWGDEREGGGGSDGADGEGEGGPDWRRQEQLLQELAKFMSGPGSLRAWQSGRLDPWGTSTSDAWFRQVERQTRSPYGPSRTGYGTSRDDDDDGGLGGGEWDPSRRVPGWSPPGRGSEWSHPRRQWDEEDRQGGGGGGPGRQGGGGGDFRRPFKI